MRGQFDFASTVERRFAFLVDHGYGLSESGAGAVRHQRDDVELSILRDWRSGEVELSIGPRDDCCSFADVLRVHDPAAAESHRDPLVWTAHDLDLALDAIAALLLEHPRGALDGDASFYAEARRLRADVAHRYTHGLHLAEIRRRAELAFRAGHDALVVEMYESIAADLTAIEHKRLEIARHRLAR